MVAWVLTSQVKESCFADLCEGYILSEGIPSPAQHCFDTGSCPYSF